MITTNTLLLLGAGASKPYGLPLGGELRDAIYTYADSDIPEVAVALFEGCGITTDEVRTFARHFDRSRAPSIDAFLENRPELAEAGKLLLAYELSRRESVDAFRGRVDDDWYAYLWRRMVVGADDARGLANNHLRIVTFNYDRSLEYILYQTTKWTYKLEDNEALLRAASLPILHLYGSLGRFHYLGGRETRTYSPDLRIEDLRTAADSILVIPEAREHRQFETARRWFDWADDIAIIGFGFDELNCERLALPAVLDWCIRKQDRRKRIFASTYQMTPKEVEFAKLRICPDQDWTALNHTSLQFLRHTDLLLR